MNLYFFGTGISRVLASVFFLRQNFGNFQQFGQGERQPESEVDEGSLCIPGEEAIARGEIERKSQVQELPVTGQ